MLSPNDPSFFEPVLSPNALACRSAGLTPVSISNMTAPPGGTRAEGAPAGFPFTQAFQLILLFHKGAPFQHFPIVWCRNSHNDAFHKLIKWQNYLGALSKDGGAGGVTSHM